MVYVLTDGQDNLIKYPYSLTDLKIENTQVSFPKTITDEIAASLNCFPVTPGVKPAVDNTYTVNYVASAVKQNDQWVEQWVSTAATTEEIEQRTSNKALEVRFERLGLLERLDWTQLPDAPVDTAAWATYRQELRDVPQQEGFPWDVTWPTPPVADLTR